MQNIKSSVCAVVPVYNAQRTLSTLAGKLSETLGRFEKYRIVFVDDGSSDGSARAMKELCEQNRNITAVMLTKNYGQQSAVLCGLAFSDCDYTAIIDDDLEQEPGDIIRLYEEISKGYDTVYGVNGAAENKGLHRRLGSRLRDRLFDLITKKPGGVRVCSFRIMNRITVENVLKADTRFVYISFEILKHTQNIKSVSVAYNSAAKSNYSFFKLAGLMMRMYVYYAPGPFKLLSRKGPCYQIKEIFTKEESA